MFRTLLTLICIASLFLLLAVGCAGEAPATSEPATSTEREATQRRYEARARADEAAANAERDVKLKELEINLVEARANAYVRETEAETFLRIQEMHEVVVADTARLSLARDNFVVLVNDHQASMVNQALLIQGFYEQMETIDHNSEAAASNSWFTNIALGLLAIGLLFSTGLMMYSFNKLTK